MKYEGAGEVNEKKEWLSKVGERGGGQYISPRKRHYREKRWTKIRLTKSLFFILFATTGRLWD